MFVSIDVDNSAKLCGDGFSVTRNVLHDKHVDFDVISYSRRNCEYRNLPGLCEDNTRVNFGSNDKNIIGDTKNAYKMSVTSKNSVEVDDNKIDKYVQAGKLVSIKVSALSQ